MYVRYAVRPAKDRAAPNRARQAPALPRPTTARPGPSQGGGVIAKSGDHGAWPAPQYYAARAITLTITASAPSQAFRDMARSLLQQAVPIIDLAVFQYNEPIPKHAVVRRSGKITETYPTLADVTFTVGLIAPDPRKYSTQANAVNVAAFPSDSVGITLPVTVPFTLPAQPPGGSVAIANQGNFETRPVISIFGPITSPVLTNVTTGQTVSWTGLELVAGDLLEVDFNVAQALLNGCSAQLTCGRPGGRCRLALQRSSWAASPTVVRP